MGGSGGGNYGHLAQRANPNVADPMQNINNAGFPNARRNTMGGGAGQAGGAGGQMGGPKPAAGGMPSAYQGLTQPKPMPAPGAGPAQGPSMGGQMRPLPPPGPSNTGASTPPQLGGIGAQPAGRALGNFSSMAGQQGGAEGAFRTAQGAAPPGVMPPGMQGFGAGSAKPLPGGGGGSPFQGQQFNGLQQMLQGMQGMQGGGGGGAMGGGK